jgi:diguanylate cyclase (GGDEF)-like protein
MWQRIRRGAAELWSPGDACFLEVEPAGELMRARLRLAVALVVLGLVVVDVPVAGLSLRALAVALAAVLVAVPLQIVTAHACRPGIGLAATVLDVTLIGAACWLLGDGSVERGLLVGLLLVALAAAAMRCEWRLCVVGGALAAVGYLAVVAMDHGGLSQPRRELTHLLVLLLGAGVLAQLAGRARALHRLSVVDAVTGVLSLSAFEQALASEATRSKRHDHELVVALVEVDQLDRLLRSFGSARAEAALRSVGGSLRRSLRRSDVVARSGAAEFALLLPETDAEAALPRFDQLRLLVASESRGGTDPEAHAGVTVSIGVAGWPADGAEPRELLAMVRSRLAEARTAGGDRVAGPPVLGAAQTPVRH